MAIVLFASPESEKGFGRLSSGDHDLLSCLLDCDGCETLATRSEITIEKGLGVLEQKTRALIFHPLLLGKADEDLKEK